MEPNKLEKQIKNQLDSRTIAPSANAWDRLDAMLTVAEKPKKKFPWLLVAASFIGFVFIGTFLFKSNVIAPLANDKIPAEVVVNNDLIINSNTDNATTTNSQPTIKSSQSITQNRVSIIKNFNQNQVATINNQKKYENNQELKVIETQNQNLIIDQNQIANVPNLKQNQEHQTSIESTIPEVKKLQIDPNLLLSQVDNELKTEYRETVFQKISRNYKTVKTAFVERNIQK